ncbi:MAG: hypothetical protein CMM58_03090 [Rhodospirillaceae bacterium]|nr:hypothetical protein [Rhodospirillaceae bacterium]
MDIFVTTALKLADIKSDSCLTKAVEKRANILKLTQAAEDAVLRPTESGAYSHTLRAALAARIARLNSEEALANRYLKSAGTFGTIADLANDGSSHKLSAVVNFMDKVAASTRSVTAEDISVLQEQGIKDADIVRLSELNSFLSYQIRLVVGLRLLESQSK